MFGSREIADGLAAIGQLASEKSQLEIDVKACHEEYDKLCTEMKSLAGELDSSKSEYTTVTNELDVCIVSDTLFVCHFDGLLSYETACCYLRA